MAATISISGAQHPTNSQGQAEKAKVYDPLKTAEGMFNGCVSRIALTLRDPKEYGKPTPLILATSSKRYQDALDDAEIQVLEVKWLLEQRLAENKAKREAAQKAKQIMATAAESPFKRKHSEVEVVESPETPSKRIKSVEQPSPDSKAPLQKTVNPDEQPQPVKTSPQPHGLSPRLDVVKTEDAEPPEPVKTEASKQIGPKPDPSPQSDPVFDIDDFTRPSTHATPAMTNEDIDMFDTMFGEPTDEVEDMANTEDHGMNFEFENEFTQDETAALDNITAINDLSQTQDKPQLQPASKDTAQTSMESLLPGLEQYAGHTDDPNIAEDPTMTNPFTTSFEPNIFDEFLADPDLSVDLNNDHGTDFGNIDIDNPDHTLDFDELFGEE